MNMEPTLVSQQTANEMAVTISKSAGLQRQQRNLQQQKQRQQRKEPEMDLVPDDTGVDVTDMTTSGPDPRGQTGKIGVRRLPAPLSFDDVSPTYFKRIAMLSRHGFGNVSSSWMMWTYPITEQLMCSERVM